mgnify:CR=1 FL=1
MTSEYSNLQGVPSNLQFEPANLQCEDFKIFTISLSSAEGSSSAALRLQHWDTMDVLGVKGLVGPKRRMRIAAQALLLAILETY